MVVIVSITGSLTLGWVLLESEDPGILYVRGKLIFQGKLHSQVESEAQSISRAKGDMLKDNAD